MKSKLSRKFRLKSRKLKKTRIVRKSRNIRKTKNSRKSRNTRKSRNMKIGKGYQGMMKSQLNNNNIPRPANLRHTRMPKSQLYNNNIPRPTNLGHTIMPKNLLNNMNLKTVSFKGDIYMCKKKGLFFKKEKCNFKPYLFKVYKNELRKDAPFELVYYKSYDLDCKKDDRVNTYLVNPQSWKAKEDNRYIKTFDDKSFCIIYTWVFEKIVVDYKNNSISFINKFNKKILGIRVVRSLLEHTEERLQKNQYPIEIKN